MADLPSIRRKAATIRTHAKSGKVLPAIQALYDTVVGITGVTLLRAEKEEFTRLIQDGSSYIMNCQEIKKVAAVDLSYTVGKEQELLDNLRLLMEVYEENIKEKAEDHIRELEAKRREYLNQGFQLLEGNNLEEARKVFASLVALFPKEPQLHAQIAEYYMQFLFYDDAIYHYGLAIELDPTVPAWYNAIGIALRKVKNFTAAEQYYLKVAGVLGKDPHLFFNLARLYIDWGQWEKAIKAGKGALLLDPDFEESKKLVNFAQKKLDNQKK